MVEASTQQMPPRSSAIVKWLVVIILAGVAVALLVELATTAATARAQVFSPAAVGRNVIAVPGQVSRDAWGVYLVDLDNSTMSVYQYQVANRKLRLLACRNFRYDLQLNDYNTQPSPQEIKGYVEDQNRGGPATSRPVETEPAQEQ